MSTRSVICFGSALWDIIARADDVMAAGYDCPGRIIRRPGGVALNVAMALVSRDVRPILLTAIGYDDEGKRLIEDLTGMGVDCGLVHRTQDPTDVYLAIENTDGELFSAIADCRSLELAGEAIASPLRDGRLSSAAAPFQGIAVIDGNPPEAVISNLAAGPELAQAQLYFAPASPGKAKRMRSIFGSRACTLFVNRDEAQLICDQKFETSRDAAKHLADICGGAVVTDGGRDATIARDGTVLSVTPPSVDVVGVTGAGDAFLAGFIAAELRGEHPATCMIEAADVAAEHISTAA